LAEAAGCWETAEPKHHRDYTSPQFFADDLEFPTDPRLIVGKYRPIVKIYRHPNYGYPE
jgi:hypothetical protein